MNTKHKLAMIPFDLRIALLYALFGGLWILLSDRLLALLVTDISYLSTVQTYKGWIFVAFSAVYLYFLLRSELIRREAAERKVLKLKRLYATLSQVNQMLVRVKQREELFQTICDVSVKFGEVSAAWIGLVEESGLIRPVATNGFNIHDRPLPVISIKDGPDQHKLIAAAVQTGTVVSSEDIQTDERTAPFIQEMQALPHRSVAVIPFQLRERTIGVLALIAKDKGMFKDPEEIQLLDEMGHDISFALNTMENDRERQQAQADLQHLNSQLEERVAERTVEIQQANRAKDEFLANMSHELRTPLNTVLGLAETLLEQQRGPLTEKQAQSLELISSSGRHLLGLINDILDLSKVEAGKLELHLERVSIKAVCESSLNFIRQLAANKLISLSLHNEESGTTIDADPQRLKQILINLLTNAVKFTPERGEVKLEVKSNQEKDRIIFSVSDTGIGIAQEDLKKLFSPFTQLDSSLARQYSGTGLGLTLVQKFTEMHNGSVQVESVPGSGSRFTIALPLRQNLQHAALNEAAAGIVDRETSADPSPVTSSIQGNILLAEDNKINLTFLADYLVSHGYHVSTAQDGEELLEKAAQTTPDIFLMDIQMPRMDGLAAIRHLRADARFMSTPIIAITALAMPGDKERCLEAGANEYMSKPVSLKNLTQTIHRLLQPKV